MTGAAIPVYVQDFGKPSVVVRIGVANDAMSIDDLAAQFGIPQARLLDAKVSSFDTVRQWRLVVIDGAKGILIQQTLDAADVIEGVLVDVIMKPFRLPSRSFKGIGELLIAALAKHGYRITKTDERTEAFSDTVQRIRNAVETYDDLDIAQLAERAARGTSS